MTHNARETLRRIGDLVEVAFKMTVQLGEESDLVLRGLFSALDGVHQAIDDIDTGPDLVRKQILGLDNDTQTIVSTQGVPQQRRLNRQ